MDKLAASSSNSPPPTEKEMTLSIAPKEQYPGFSELVKQRSVLASRDATVGRSNKEIMTELKREASRGISPYPGKGTQEDPYIVDW
jgi:hypothetical protein